MHERDPVPQTSGKALFRAIAIRRINDPSPSETAYWYPVLDPATDEPLLEPDETVFLRGTARVESQTINGNAWRTDWSMPKRWNFWVTDRRVVYSSRNFAEARIPIRIGEALAPLIIRAKGSDNANIARAKRVWNGHIAVGQIRHDWLTSVDLAKIRAEGFLAETELHLTTRSEAGFYRILITKADPPIRSSDVDEVVAAAAAARLRCLTPAQRASESGGVLEQARHQPLHTLRPIERKQLVRLHWSVPNPMWEPVTLTGPPPPFVMPRHPRSPMSPLWRLVAALAVCGWVWDAMTLHGDNYFVVAGLFALTVYAVYMYRGVRWPGLRRLAGSQRRRSRYSITDRGLRTRERHRG